MIKKIIPSIIGRDVESINPLNIPIKIGFIGVFDDKNSSSIPFVRHLEKLEMVEKIIKFDYRTSMKKGPIGNTMSKIMDISKEVDLIIVAKGNGIPVHTFQMASINCSIYFWMPDIFSHFKNKNLLDSTRYCAYRSATGYGTALLLSDKIQLPVYHVIDGTDPEIYFPEEREKVYDIIFIGASDPERNTVYEYFKKLNYNIKFFGPHYTRHVGVDEFRQLCSESKLILNISRGNYPGYTSLRLWNTLACGSMVLTKTIPQMEELLGLVDKKHIVDFKNLVTLKKYVDYYLLHDDERETIAKNALEFVKENRTWTNTSNDIIKIVTTESGSYTKSRQNFKLQKAQKYLKKSKKVKEGWINTA